MAMILITDNPQGGACRCEGQELDLAKLNPEQVEALKQALGINANASQGSGQADFSALSPEQVEALKQALGINASTAQALDINALLKAEIDPNAFEKVRDPYQEAFKKFFGRNKTLAESLAEMCYYVVRARSMAFDVAEDLLGKGILNAKYYDVKYKIVGKLPED